MAQEYAKNFYQSATWIKISKAIRTNKLYTCERCGGYGNIVHHIKHITPENITDYKITLAPENLMLLCNDCHNKIHANKLSTADGYKFTSDGDIVPLADTSPRTVLEL